MAFAPGDSMFLWLLFEYHYLKSSQVAKLTGRGVRVCRRRLQELQRLEMVKAMDTAAMDENAYTLGTKGWEFIAYEMGTTVEHLPFSREAVRVQSIFWKHTILVNDIRIALTLGAASHPDIVLHRYIPEWEQVARPHRQGKAHKQENYLLWDRLEDKGQHKIYDHRPDGCCLVGRKNDPADAFAALFLEADRGTETIRRKIDAKYAAYRLYFNNQLYFRQFGAGRMRVLFVLSDVATNLRIRHMQDHLQKIAHQLGDPNPEEDGNSPASFVHLFRFVRFDQLSDESVWDDPVWQDWRGREFALYRAPEMKTLVERDGSPTGVSVASE